MYNQSMINKTYQIPAKPGIELKAQAEDARAYCVLPMRVCYDKTMTSTDFRMLCLLASYASNNGFTFVSTNTLAARRGTSRQSVSKQLKKLVTKGYVITVRKGYNNIRGALRRIVFDASLSNEDVIAISNTPINEPSKERITMERLQAKQKVHATVKVDALTPISFSDAMLVVSEKIINDYDLIKLEKLINSGITLAQLKSAYPV
jgi:DNA-binding MarR family transcriptional regulator